LVGLSDCHVERQFAGLNCRHGHAGNGWNTICPLGTAAVGLGILVLVLVFILATPTTPARVITAAAGQRHRPGSRPISALPATSKWRKNGWGSPRNLATSERIASDQSFLRRRRVYLSQWGPNAAKGKIEVFLVHYSVRAARILYARYGCAIDVSRRSQGYADLLPKAASWGT